MRFVWLQDPLLTAIIAAEVQAFYAYRIYILSSRRNVWLPAVVAALTACQLGARRCQRTRVPKGRASGALTFGFATRLAVFGFLSTGLALRAPTFAAIAAIDYAVATVRATPS